MADDNSYVAIVGTEEHFTKKALKEQDGLVVPLTDKPGGTQIGTATMKYREDTGVLEAHFQVDDKKTAEALKPDVSGFSIFKKES